MTKTAERLDDYITLDEIAKELEAAPATVEEADKLGIFTKVPETGRIPRLQFEREEWTPSNLNRRISQAKSDRTLTWVFSLTITVFTGVVIGGLLGQIFSY